MEQESLYDIFDRGLYRITPASRTGTYEISPENLSQGSVFAGLDVGGTGTKGFHADKLGGIWSGAALFADAVFSVTEKGVVTASDLTLTGGIIKYGKTSFTDSTNAGYHISSSGIYISSASDTSVLKYTVASGVFDFIGTVSSRSTATIAATINSSGNVITDLINARLDTSAKNILASFSFGVSGAIQIGTYSAGVSGDIKLSPSGIVGRNSAGTNTFAIDGTTGEITAIKLVGATGTIGGFDIGTDYIRDVANSFGLASTVTGGDDVRFWAGDTFANRAIAPFRITEAGAITGSNITITGGSVVTSILSGLVALSNTNIAAQGWTQTSAFSVTDLDTVAWGAGIFTTAGGTAYSIGAGNTGNMAARTYIYLDIAVSTTAYQITTTASTAVGAGKVLVATAINGTVEPEFEVFGGIGGSNINASQIVAGSITANEIAASTITAGKLSVSVLSAITADLGNITAGTITLNTSGYIQGGQTAYATGTGFFLGYSTDAYKLSLGTSTKYLKYDGTDIELVGGAFKNSYTAGENLTAGQVVCIKNSSTDYIATEDSYTDGSNPTTNYGTGVPLFIKASGNQLETFIKFSIASVPSTENIQKALLRVKVRSFTGTGTPIIKVIQITSADWAEGTITHNNKPSGNTFEEDQVTISVNTVDSWIEFDITRLVRGWKETGLSNYGIVLTSSLATCDVSVYSRESAGNEPHIRVLNNITSDGKVYKAKEPAAGSFAYDTVKHVVGFAAETKSSGQAIKIYDVPGAVSGLSIGNVVAGTILYVSSTAGDIVTDPINLVHLTQVGIGKGTGDILLAPLKPLLIEQYPVNSSVLPNLYGDTTTLKLFTPSDCMKVVINFEAKDAAGLYSGKGSLTVMRVGKTEDFVTYRVAAGIPTEPALTASWSADTITITNRTYWMSTPDTNYPQIKAYFYSK